MLTGCYRKSEVEDPAIFAAALMTILTSYPETIVRTVTDPMKGLPGKLKWLPTPAEVREECQRLLDVDNAITQSYQRRIARERETAEYNQRIARVSPEQRREIVDEWRRNVRSQMPPEEGAPPPPRPLEAILADHAARPLEVSEEFKALNRRKFGLADHAVPLPAEPPR